MIGICPRCGRELVRSSTPTGKVCFRCASCGGVAVTLPVLRESLDARSIAALTRSARAAEHAGCTCPGCGGSMSLLKVGDGKNKLEIDVCGRCLSVWCDKGEYETLAPPLPKSGERSMRELVAQASPEARERYADALLESLPEEISPADFDIGDILRDIARLIIGVPTLWRTVKPVSPIFTILLTLAMPVAQVCIYYQFHDLHTASYAIRFPSRYRDFWYISASMAEKYGFDLSAPLNALTFPFVQISGRMALFYAFLLFIPLAAVERRIGHARFIGLFFAFVAVSSLAQVFFATLGLTTGYLCGIVPIAIGFLTYTSFAWPDLRIRDRIGLMSVYSGIVGLFLLAFPMLNAFALDFLSCGVGPIAACLALGAILGRRSRKLRCTAL